MATVPPPLPPELVERRCAKRRRTSLRVEFCPVENEGALAGASALRVGVASDLSPAGFSLSRAGALSVGSVLRLFLHLGDSNQAPVACYAKVARADFRDVPRYGCQFMGLPLADAHRVYRYVREGEDASRSGPKRLPPPPPQPRRALA